jgi:Zn-dependent protease with chaperone function
MAIDATPATPAIYFDGTSSRKRRVTVKLGDGLELIEDGGVVAAWPFDSVRRVDGPAGLLRLSSAAAKPLARLEIGDPAAIETVMSRCGSLDAGGARQTGRIVFWSIAAVSSIVAVVIYGIPLAADRLAPLIPSAVEQRIGDTVAIQVRSIFGDSTCDQEQGHAALAALVDKLRLAGGLQRPLDAQVLSSSIPNAFALPGGRVFLLDALLQQAGNPDELAGILAHELGHVYYRHSMRMLIQTGGTSFLLGLLLGDVTGGGAVIFAARSVLQASHSREAEQEADDFAAAIMQKLGRSPLPMAVLLFRITGEQKKSLAGFTILNSHPLTEDRVARMNQIDRPNTGPELLSATEWRALRNICRKG